MNVLTVIGARPQFIKAAALSRALMSHGLVTETMVHTGQHFDSYMSQIFFDELQIPSPKYNLGIHGGPHGQMTGRMLEALEAVMIQIQPNWVLVYGDTNSTLSGALAAVKLGIPVAHVEAGLRSYNRRMPEEINRVLTDHAADLLFAPTDLAVDNLHKEGISQDKIKQSGDVMYDSAIYYGRMAEQSSDILGKLEIDQGGYILATCHRAENTDNEKRLHAIFGGLGKVADRIPIILPLHPRTKKCLENFGMLENVSEMITLVDPVGYLDMVMLEKNAAMVVTDSGGVQKEAFFYRVPCVTLRDETEWIELVNLGWNRLVSPISAAMVADGIEAGLGTMGKHGEPYGQGDAANRIIDTLISSG